jgi:GT2 family glycosyltransferase
LALINKIGLAVITYARPDYLKQCLQSLDLHSWGGSNRQIIVVDEEDGPKYDSFDRGEHDFYFGPNKGVASAKNRAITQLLGDGCEHIFVMEDDILMKRNDTCIAYINYAKITKVPHLNFALHGVMNKGKGRYFGSNNPDCPTILCYPEVVGAFSYYTKEILAEVGLMDENFKNAWEHVEHTWRICKTGKIPKFWYFMDHPVSDLLLEEIPGSIDNSSIRPRPDWMKNIEEGANYWQKKHGEFLPDKPAWDRRGRNQ